MNGPTRSRKPVDEYYLSLLASQWPHACRQKSQPRSLNPPLMRSTMHTPTKGRDSTAMSSATAVAAIYYLWLFPWEREKLGSELMQPKSPACKAGLFLLPRRRHRDPLSAQFTNVNTYS